MSLHLTVNLVSNGRLVFSVFSFNLWLLCYYSNDIGLLVKLLWSEQVLAQVGMDIHYKIAVLRVIVHSFYPVIVNPVCIKNLFQFLASLLVLLLRNLDSPRIVW